MILECFGSNVASLHLVEIKFKNGIFVQELLNAILLQDALSIIKVLGHSKFDSPEARGNHLADISARNASLKEPNNSQTSVIVQRDTSPNDNLEKLAREAQQLVSEKEKQDWKFNNCWLDKKRKLWFGPNNNPVLPETLKFLLITIVPAINHWSTNKMIAFMNKYWWKNVKKTAKSA